MKPQAFQRGELRDEHDQIIRAGAYGKKTPFVNSENNAILDYIMNNFDALYAQIPNGRAYVKSVNNITPDSNGNVTINVGSGGGGETGTNITVDSTLSSASTNPVQNKVIYAALNNKLDKYGIAAYATRDSSGNIITDTYAKKSEVSGVVKSVNNITPDNNGNVNISVSGGGSGSGISTSTQNTWTAQQSFDLALLIVEKYKTTYANGNSVKPSSVTAVYNATGSFTLDLTNFFYLLSTGQSLVFTAYIKANADYPLTITNGGTLKYTGNPSDLAITSAGLLLNIFITLDNSGNKTSIVQTSKLS